MPWDPGGRLQWAFRSQSCQGHSPAGPPLPGGEWKPGSWPLNVMSLNHQPKDSAGLPSEALASSWRGSSSLLASPVWPPCPGRSVVVGVSREHHQEA